MTDKFGRRQSVPCGKCYECLRDKQQEWCFRLDQEKRYSDCSFFVTFTYQDEELIWADTEPCLYKRHMQLFFKLLRKYIAPGKIKYYCVGEYGDIGNRPHYHALIFYRGKLDWFTISRKIQDCWQRGICQVLPVQGAQGYVTKYILKFDSREHLVKPFSLISHGLGIDYLSDSMIAFHRKNLVNFATKPGGYRIKLPRYYQDKIFSMYNRLLIKKHADLYRRKLEIKRLDLYDIQLDFGLNPFRERNARLEQQLHKSLQIYRMKKKL